MEEEPSKIWGPIHPLQFMSKTDKDYELQTKMSIWAGLDTLGAEVRAGSPLPTQ